MASQLIPGKPGQFDVEVDGRLIWSKAERNRFPEHFEVTDQLK